MIQPAREHDVSIEPRAARRHLRKGHANVEGDAGLFGKDLDRADVLDRGDDGVKERTDLRRLSREVMREIVAPACVRLIAVRELAAASLATPQGRGAQGMAREDSMPDDTPSGEAAPRSRRRWAPGAR